VARNVLDLNGRATETAPSWDGAGPGTWPFLVLACDQFVAWPLLVLDAGEFLTRCRWCDWTSPRQPTPGAALAAFDAHICKERSA